METAVVSAITSARPRFMSGILVPISTSMVFARRRGPETSNSLYGLSQSCTRSLVEEVPCSANDGRGIDAEVAVQVFDLPCLTKVVDPEARHRDRIDTPEERQGVR